MESARYAPPSPLSFETLLTRRDAGGRISTPAPKVDSAWTDYNGHLNGAFFLVLFNRAADAVFASIGVTGADYAEKSGANCFTLESHITYRKEVHASDDLQTTFQLVGWDEKRAHYYLELIKDGQTIAATTEQILIHVDLSTRRPTPFPEFARERFKTLSSGVTKQSTPPDLGRVIALRRK